MASILKRLKIAQVEKRNWRDELSDYLTMYRTTPHSTTGVSQSEMLFKRKIWKRLPTLDTSFYDPDDMDQGIRDRDAEKKGIAKYHADEQFQAKESDVAEGDKVLLKQRCKNKLSSNSDAEPYEVVSKKGNSVTVQKSGASYKRNVTHVKKYCEPISDDNACEPNDVNIESPESEKCENVPDVSVNLRPVRIRKLPSIFDDFVMT